MKNILLKIEYEGTGYFGWQTQRRKEKTSGRPGSPTIQETLETLLFQILREKVNLISSGRTDSGVHAREQAANFKTDSKMPAGKIKKALNGLLPADIRIKSVSFVSADFHARFSASSKVYRYFIVNFDHCPVFLRACAHHFGFPLDISLMRKEAQALIGRKDFKSFQASDKIEKNSVRRVKNVKIGKKGSLITIDIEADGFLYNMVRNIVGTLIEVGRGKMPAGSMKKIIAAKDRRRAGPTAPAKGLFLWKVNYK